MGLEVSSFSFAISLLESLIYGFLLAFEARGLGAGEGVNGSFQLGWLVV
jgi:hypothetical protein